MHTIISPQTAALVLSYLHRHACPYLPGRHLAAGHLRNLATWIGAPAPELQSVRAHRPLAAHLMLLQAAGLLAADSGIWVCLPAVYTWLKMTHEEQVACLLKPLLEQDTWEARLSQYGLSKALPLDYTVYIRQSLTRQLAQTPAYGGQVIRQPATTDEEWRLLLPDTLSPWLLLHLLQLGEWTPGEALSITPLSLAAAAKRGYWPSMVESFLAAATGDYLDDADSLQLMEWVQRQEVYRLRRVWLLSTRQPEQLAAVAATRRLHDRFHEQISPRHAVVAPEIAESLQRWLARQGYPLDRPEPPGAKGNPHAEYVWLGLKLLISLGELIPLPCPAPHSSLEAAAAQLTPAQQAELAFYVDEIIEGTRSALRGRDAFFPAREGTKSEYITAVRQALVEERPLLIRYQALGDTEARRRRIEPLLLEERGSLYYLHAYCYLAEANRVFRLDRLHNCEIE
jgi:hypothetical protein